MQQLKLALGKNKQNPMEKSKNINKSKSQSMWVFQDDSDEHPKNNHVEKVNDSTTFLESQLMDLFKKDKRISQTAFDRIVEEFQEEIGQGKTQISYLLVIEDRITDLAEEFNGQKKKFFEEFISMVQSRISQIRKRQKKNQLLQYDKIVKNNFKKKQNTCDIQENGANNFLGFGPIRQRQKSASKSRSKSRNKDKSSDKPLNKLLVKEKLLKKQKWSQNQDNINQTHSEQNQQSVSFSAVMSASCAVKQRNRPRRNTKKKIEVQMHQNNKQQDGEQDGEKAFVFYRPKKGK